MIMGFPGKTNEYLPAEGLEMVYSQTNADKVSIREQRLKIWKEAMGTNDTIQLNYSAKYRTLANYYKKWSLENQISAMMAKLYANSNLSAGELRDQLYQGYREMAEASRNGN